MSAGDHGDAVRRRRFGLGAVVVVVVAALAITVGIGVLRGATAPVEQITIEATPDTSATSGTSDGELYVHVSGAVTAPGLYVLSSGSRVVDAIAAASGFADDADPEGVNLARPLDDGEQLRVPRIGETEAPAAGAGGATGDGLVDLNTADSAQLETLPRIGPAMAERIIAWRVENGGFASVEDLLAVPGIGDKMLKVLRELVRV